MESNRSDQSKSDFDRLFYSLNYFRWLKVEISARRCEGRDLLLCIRPVWRRSLRSAWNQL